MRRGSVLHARGVRKAVALLLLAGCAGSPPEGEMDGPDPLGGTSWRLEDLGGSEVLDGVQATLEFLEAGRVAGNSSCNQFSGEVEVVGDSLSFGPLAVTRRACAEAVNDQETRYLAALDGARRFEIEEPSLLIYTADTERPLRFVRVGSAGAGAGTDRTGVGLPEDLLGVWTVVGHEIPGVSALTDTEAATWHGRTIRLTEAVAVSPVDRCNDPTYAIRIVTADSLLGESFRLSPGALASVDSGDRVRLLEVSCTGADWVAMGGVLVGIEEDRALTPWNGVFFEVRKTSGTDEVDVDFRAVGNEPFWSLEIVEGQWMHFSYAVGEREAHTPVPEPEIDEATNTTVYHAVTESSDLRVAIEQRRCLDDMSGAPHETTVSVTLNGDTYRGCGGSIP